MLNQNITIFLILAFLTNLKSQSNFTSILFEKSDVVFKGKIEHIYNDGTGNAEGSYYYPLTIVEKVYKNKEPTDTIGVVIHQPLIIAKNENIKSCFQLTVGKTYIFFIKQPESPSTIINQKSYFNLADNQIEAIPFSKKLESELVEYKENSVIKLDEIESYNMHTLLRMRSEISKIKIRKIKRENNQYHIYGRNEFDKKVIIKSESLNCICSLGRIEIDETYFMYLSKENKNKYYLADKWIGVFDMGHLNTYQKYHLSKKDK